MRIRSGIKPRFFSVSVCFRHQAPPTPQNDYTELIQQIAFLSNFNPAEAENLEFKPVGDGFVMTAHFPDGQTASYILTPLDGGKSFNLVALNK